MIRKSRKERNAWNGYVRSVFLRYIINHPEVNQASYFPPYFQSELKILDGYSYARKLLKKGYLTRGNKDILLLSDQGRRAIKDEYLRFFDAATPYVTFSEYIAEREQMNAQESAEVIMLSVLLKKIKVLKSQNNYIAVKDVHLDVAQLYEQVGVPEKAMYHYLVSLYYDVSGLEYYDELILYAKGKHERKRAEKEFVGICIRPQVMQGLRRMNEAYDPRMIHEIFVREQININLCPEGRLQTLAAELCSGAYDFNEWRAYFEKNYRSILRSSEGYRGKKSEQSRP